MALATGFYQDAFRFVGSHPPARLQVSKNTHPRERHQRQKPRSRNALQRSGDAGSGKIGARSVPAGFVVYASIGRHARGRLLIPRILGREV